MAKKMTPQPRTPQVTLAQLAKRQEEIENTLSDIKHTMLVFERHYRRRGEVLVKIVKNLSDELRMHQIMEAMERDLTTKRTVLEREISSRKTEKLS